MILRRWLIRQLPRTRRRGGPDEVLVQRIGASVETAYRVREQIGVGPFGWRLFGGKFYGPSFSFEESAERFTRWSWLRLPPNVFAHLRAGEHGFKAWVKTGHLRKP